MSDLQKLHVALFAHVEPSANPYIALMRKSLQEAGPGITVSLEREFTLRWLLSRWRQVDIVHLHWIENVYTPLRWALAWAEREHGLCAKPGRWLDRLANNRFTRRGRAAIKLGLFAGGLVAVRLVGIKVVYTVHNLTAHRAQPLWFRMLNRAANHIVFALAHAVHVHSEETRRRVAEEYGRTQMVFTIPHGNYVGCYPNTLSKEEARAQLGLPEADFVYLFLGMIRPYKGLEELIPAFTALGDESCRLVIAGNPLLSDDYACQVENMVRGQPRIHLSLGFVPDDEVQFYLKACDVCVLPYRNVTTSGAALLALSFGRPVVAPAIGGFPELIGGGRGVLYEPSEMEGLQRALHRARQLVWSEGEILAWVRQFDWPLLARQHLAVYRRILAKGRPLRPVAVSESET